MAQSEGRSPSERSVQPGGQSGKFQRIEIDANGRYHAPKEPPVTDNTPRFVPNLTEDDDDDLPVLDDSDDVETPKESDPFDRLISGVPRALSSIGDQVASLHEMNLMQQEIKRLQDQIALRAAREAVEEIQESAKQIALESVRNGELSRVKAAEMLGVHQGTVAKWLKEQKPGQ